MAPTLNKIVKSTLDLHYHIGPEIIPRKYENIRNLIRNQEGKIAGLALKNHFYPTVPLINQLQDGNGMIIIGSVVLNNFVGGLNSEAIYATSLISKGPFIVWLPTINARNFLDRSEFEIPVEWIQKKDFKARTSNSVKGISVLNNKNNLGKNALEVLRAVKNTNAILATGHLSWLESKKIAMKALQIGIKKIIITHPIYQRINMPLKEQIKLAQEGCFIEICYSMYSIDKMPVKNIVNQINRIGAKNIILSSDMGQKFSPDPNSALTTFAKLLIKEGIDLTQLYLMLAENTRKIVF